MKTIETLFRYIRFFATNQEALRDILAAAQADIAVIEASQAQIAQTKQAIVEGIALARELGVKI